MKGKLIIRLLIVLLYFIIDILYTLCRVKGHTIADTIIDKGLLFIMISISVYLITRNEHNRMETTSSPT